MIAFLWIAICLMASSVAVARPVDPPSMQVLLDTAMAQHLVKAERLAWEIKYVDKNPDQAAAFLRDTRIDTARVAEVEARLDWLATSETYGDEHPSRQAAKQRHQATVDAVKQHIAQRNAAMSFQLTVERQTANELSAHGAEKDQFKTQLQLAIAEVRIEAIEVNARRWAFMELKSADGKLDPLKVGPLIDDPVVSALLADYDAILLEQAANSIAYLDNHPTSLALASALKRVEAALSLETERAMAALQAKEDMLLGLQTDLEKQLRN
jgi:hypothetical protein